MQHNCRLLQLLKRCTIITRYSLWAGSATSNGRRPHYLRSSGWLPGDPYWRSCNTQHWWILRLSQLLARRPPATQPSAPDSFYTPVTFKTIKTTLRYTLSGEWCKRITVKHHRIALHLSRRDWCKPESAKYRRRFVLEGETKKRGRPQTSRIDKHKETSEIADQPYAAYSQCAAATAQAQVNATVTHAARSRVDQFVVILCSTHRQRRNAHAPIRATKFDPPNALQNSV